MAKTTVAQLETRVEELETQLAQMLHVNQYQAYALNDALKRIKHAHGRLDQARDVIRSMKGDQAKTTQQTSSKSTAPRTKTLQPCTVNGCPGHKLVETATKHAAYATK